MLWLQQKWETSEDAEREMVGKVREDGELEAGIFGDGCNRVRG